jgi:hypothetical protein
MTTKLTKRTFLDSEKAKLLRDELTTMVKSKDYNTQALYSPAEGDGNQFVEKHMTYMSEYLGMDHWQYISNLKLKTKIRK